MIETVSDLDPSAPFSIIEAMPLDGRRSPSTALIPHDFLSMLEGIIEAMIEASGFCHLHSSFVLQANSQHKLLLKTKIIIGYVDIKTNVIQKNPSLGGARSYQRACITC